MGTTKTIVMSVMNTPKTAATVAEGQDAVALGVAALAVWQVEVTPTCKQAPHRLGSLGPRQPAVLQEEWQLAVSEEGGMLGEGKNCYGTSNARNNNNKKKKKKKKNSPQFSPFCCITNVGMPLMFHVNCHCGPFSF